MNDRLMPEDLLFQKEVVTFLDEELPPERRFKHHLLENSTEEATRWWHRTLCRKRWVAPSWPKEWGGTEWSSARRQIFEWELARAGAPRISEFGVALLGPIIFTFGSDRQKRQHLPRILDGSTLWCQGYSEPGSGSDLASLRTRGVRKGDHYVVNGQKIWTTHAHWADWIFCLVRTNVETKPQAGISFFLIDMKSQGVEVRPITSIDGLHHLNEVFFTDVEVPLDCLVGLENNGWTYAKHLLDNERASVAGTAQTHVSIQETRRLIRKMSDESGAFWDARSFENQLAELDIRLLALGMLEQRALAEGAQSGDAGKLRLPLKLLGSTLQQDVSELNVALMEYSAYPRTNDQFGDDPTKIQSSENLRAGELAMRSYLYQRASTIYGGTSEVQRNIMARIIVGT